MGNIKANILFCIASLVSLIGIAQPKNPTPIEGDYLVKDFAFESKESLPELNLHYTTFGKLEKDKNGRAMNAVLIMHATGGSGRQFLSEQFTGNLFNGGQLLDQQNTLLYCLMPSGMESQVSQVMDCI